VTLEQVEAWQRKSVSFARNVLENDDLADELEDEDPYGYAVRKHLKITNPIRRQASMANGNGGNGKGDDYDFGGWTKADCVDTLNQVAQIADAAFDPISSREDMAQALGDILDALSDDEDGDEEDEDDDDSTDDGQ
jgi:hypothetical protein